MECRICRICVRQQQGWHGRNKRTRRWRRSWLDNAGPRAQADGGAARQRRSKQLHDDRSAGRGGTYRFGRAYGPSGAKGGDMYRFDRACRPPRLAGAARGGGTYRCDRAYRLPCGAEHCASRRRIGRKQHNRHAPLEFQRRMCRAAPSTRKRARPLRSGVRAMPRLCDGRRPLLQAGKPERCPIVVPPECLPGDVADVTLRLGDGIEQKDLDIIIAHMQPPPTADPTVQEAAVSLLRPGRREVQRKHLAGHGGNAGLGRSTA